MTHLTISISTENTAFKRNTAMITNICVISGPAGYKVLFNYINTPSGSIRLNALWETQNLSFSEESEIMIKYNSITRLICLTVSFPFPLPFHVTNRVILRLNTWLANVSLYQILCSSILCHKMYHGSTKVGTASWFNSSTASSIVFPFS